MASACEFPDELLAKPLGYVGVTGLDTQNNAMHKSIWETFSINRRQEKVINIKLLPGDAEFPVKKIKQRTSYEFYIPKGVLKRNWMAKHLNQLPALVVIFFDLDWNDSSWKEKQTECASRVAVIKSSLQGRTTKIAVVLIQKNMPLPPGEDPQAAQRAQALCQACEVQSNSLFVLPFGDHLLGYITRLEGAFYEILQNFYSEETKFIKQHKELLNKSQHQLLYIRHQFKMAYYSELKQDSNLALKHYKQAYQYTLEVKLTDVNQLEIKLVAGFLNYKICRISFQLNAPLDAISHFRKHIDYFKMFTGTNQLVFEHCAWMAKQFSLFGDLFHDAIKNGLQAIQTQHPGFYYQQAANYTVMRMKYCKTVCKFSEKSETSATYLSRENLEFYGQRPWRQYCQANEAPDPAMEQIGIHSLQAEELKVEHYWIIIPLLSSAVAQFREYKSVRMKLFLMVQMGQEYFNAKDYSKALTLFTRVKPYYRGERWWKLLTNVLVTSLRCAYLTASVQEYISICLELIGKHCVVQHDEKTRLQLNLQRVIKQSPPEAENGCDEESVETAKQLWIEAFQKTENQICYVDMENLASFVECRAAFESDVYYLDGVASVSVYLRSVGAYPIPFNELGLSFSNPIYNSMCTKESTNVQDTASSDLYMESGKVQKYTFNFVLSPQDVGKKLEIKQIYLRLGESTVLRWKGAGLDANISPSFDSSNYGGEKLPVKYHTNGNIIWETVTISPFTDVVPRVGKVTLTVDHNTPSLLDEFYPMTVNIHNKEEESLSNTKLIIRLDHQEGKEKSKATLYLDETDGGDNISGLNQVEFDMEEVPPESKITKIIHLKSHEAGIKTVTFKISYNIEVEVGEERNKTMCSCAKEEVIKVDTLLPVSVSVNVANMMLLPADKIYFDQPFVLNTHVKCTSPWPIHLISTELILSNGFRLADKESTNQITDIHFKEDEIANECHPLVIPFPSTADQLHVAKKSIFIGSYVLRWKRLNGEIVTQSKVNLPLVKVDFAPISITADIQAMGCLDESMACHYTIHNLTHLVQEIEVSIEASDSFMLAGNRQIQLRILPTDKHTLSYSIYPLSCGELPLPKLHVNLPAHHSLKTDFLSQQKLPTHVFIKPNVTSTKQGTAIEVK